MSRTSNAVAALALLLVAAHVVSAIDVVDHARTRLRRRTSSSSSSLRADSDVVANVHAAGVVRAQVGVDVSGAFSEKDYADFMAKSNWKWGVNTLEDLATKFSDYAATKLEPAKRVATTPMPACDAKTSLFDGWSPGAPAAPAAAAGATAATVKFEAKFCVHTYMRDRGLPDARDGRLRTVRWRSPPMKTTTDSPGGFYTHSYLTAMMNVRSDQLAGVMQASQTISGHIINHNLAAGHNFVNTNPMNFWPQGSKSNNIHSGNWGRMEKLQKDIGFLCAYGPAHFDSDADPTGVTLALDPECFSEGEIEFKYIDDLNDPATGQRYPATFVKEQGTDATKNPYLPIGGEYRLMLSPKAWSRVFEVIDGAVFCDKATHKLPFFFLSPLVQALVRHNENKPAMIATMFRSHADKIDCDWDRYDAPLKTDKAEQEKQLADAVGMKVPNAKDWSKAFAQAGAVKKLTQEAAKAAWQVYDGDTVAHYYLRTMILRHTMYKQLDPYAVAHPHDDVFKVPNDRCLAAGARAPTVVYKELPAHMKPKDPPKTLGANEKAPKG